MSPSGAPRDGGPSRAVVSRGWGLHYDAEGSIVAIEVLLASTRTDNPSRIELLPA